MNEELQLFFFTHVPYQFLLMKSPSFLIQRLSFPHNVNSFRWMKNCCSLYTCTISSFWWRVLFFAYNVNSFWWLENYSCLLHMYHQFLLIKIPYFLVQRQFVLMNEELLLSFTHVPSVTLDEDRLLLCVCTTSVLFDEWRTAVVSYTCTISSFWCRVSFLIFSPGPDHWEAVLGRDLRTAGFDRRFLSPLLVSK